MKTTVIKGKPLATFDSDLMKMVRCEETTMRQVEKFDFRFGIRNENEQLYRVFGVSGDDTEKLRDHLEYIGFTDELEDKKPKQGCDSIFKLTPKVKWLFEENDN